MRNLDFDLVSRDSIWQLPRRPKSKWLTLLFLSGVATWFISIANTVANYGVKRSEISLAKTELVKLETDLRNQTSSKVPRVSSKAAAAANLASRHLNRPWHLVFNGLDALPGNLTQVIAIESDFTKDLLRVHLESLTPADQALTTASLERSHFFTSVSLVKTEQIANGASTTSRYALELRIPDTNTPVVKR